MTFLIGYIVGMIAGACLVGFCLAFFRETDCEHCILVQHADKGVA